MSSESLYCPACGSHHGPDAAYCQACSSPLPATERQLEADAEERANRKHKIDKRYTEGELVKIAFGRNQADSELIQNILLDAGIPSMLRRSGGFDVPDFLAAGPRDVMIAQSAETAAREVLGELATGDLSAAHPEPLKLLLWVVAAVVFAGMVVVIIAAAS